MSVMRRERRSTRGELERHHPERPPVHRPRVVSASVDAFVSVAAPHEFGGQILRGAQYRVRPPPLPAAPSLPAALPFPAQTRARPEVDEFRVARDVQEDVLGFQVPVRDTDDGVQVVQRGGDGRDVEASDGLGEPPVLPHLGSKLPARDVLQQDVQRRGVLEVREHARDARVRRALQFAERVSLALDERSHAGTATRHRVLRHGLEREVQPRPFVTHEPHHADRPVAEDVEELVRVQAPVLAGQRARRRGGRVGTLLRSVARAVHRRSRVGPAPHRAETRAHVGYHAPDA